MKKALLKFFLCPNNQVGDFVVFANELKRANQLLSNVDHNDIDDNDDVRTGFIANRKHQTVYPITNYVLLALSDRYADHSLYIDLLTSALQYSPPSYGTVIMKNIERLRPNTCEPSGSWNRQEMEYYDRAVETEHLRRTLCDEIRRKPLWHIYIERKNYLLSELSLPDSSYVLEIGCGNARTVGWLFPPNTYNHKYVGTDVSLKRLMLAKMVIPEGDFVQCSALHLPFKNQTFAAVFSFGVLHHLEDPLRGAKVCLSKLSKEGYFLIHEPIEKPRKLLPERKCKFLRSIFTTYSHSEHDNHIQVGNILRLFEEQNSVIQEIHFNASALRTVVSRIFAFFPRINNSAMAWKFLIAADRTFIKLFCFKPNRFGPGGVFVRLKKGCSS